MAGRTLGCPAGHSFDVARQGYVNLTAARGGDNAAMVDARERFLATGAFEPLTAALCAEPAGSHVLDVGAGPGHHLARVLGAHPSALGLALDSSKPALRRAARAHPRAAAIGCDAWRPLPLRDGVADLVMCVFAPRQPSELLRVLAPGGVLMVVTPAAGHLAELVGSLGLLRVGERKEERLDEQLGAPLSRRSLEWQLSLSAADAALLVGMGPSAWHRAEDSVPARLPEQLAVTASVTLSRYGRS